MKIIDAAIERDGVIYRGRRHYSIIKNMVEAGCKPPIKQSEQGFVDENGKFYDRLMAKEVAKRAGQIPKTFNKVLLSEDLW